MGSSQEIFDIHTHVLPGIDDGADSWNESLNMMKTAWDSGVRKMIATPHFLPWEKQIIPEEIRHMCREAKDRFSERYGLQMMVYPGEELYYYSELLEDLENGKAMTMNETDCILVEFGVMVQFRDLMHAMQNLQRGGYRIILAHYERYKALRDEEHIKELLERGIMLQSNLEAIDGSFFDSNVKRIKRDYKRGYISFAASDMHNTVSRPPIRNSSLKRLSKCLDHSELREVLYENAHSVFER